MAHENVCVFPVAIDNRLLRSTGPTDPQEQSAITVTLKPKSASRSSEDPYKFVELAPYTLIRDARRSCGASTKV